MNYKNIIGIVLVIALVSYLFLYAMRWANAQTVITSVKNPAPHIECVVVTSSDGVGVDCNWDE